jgi:hypothetical protein
MAETVSIPYDDDTINRVLGNMADNSNMSFDEYVSALEDAGVYLQTRNPRHNRMKIQDLQRGMVKRPITITDQELHNFLNSEMGREIMAPDFFIDHMAIASSTTDSTEDDTGQLRYSAEIARKNRRRRKFP